ncbi:MAG: hypothetical protein JRI34_07255, partial [Deltaproteobacteria bacterium]|nr:hypothetical protein [Deltaproteobacteria bacterium]
MSIRDWYDAIPIGMELGPVEMTLDEVSVRERVKEVQWEAGEVIDSLGLVP